MSNWLLLRSDRAAPLTYAEMNTPLSMTDVAALPIPLSRAVRDAAPQPFSELVHLAFDRPDLISLAAGLVDYDTLPGPGVEPLTKHILSDPATARAALQYGTTVGFAGFRQQLYDHMAQLDDAVPEAYPGSVDDVVVTTGSQQLLNLLGEVMIDPGDIVIAGWPSYFVYMTALTTFGVTIRAVDLDDKGMCPDKLERLLSGLYAAGQIHRLKFVYVVSYHQNPTGITLDTDRRKQILDLVKYYSEKSGQRILIVEDAAYRELTYDGEAPPSMKSFDVDNQYVALCQTFSKPFSPGLKTGYGLMPSDLIAPLTLCKDGRDFGSSNFNQHVLSRAMSTGIYAEHVERLCKQYANKIHATLDAIDKHFSNIDGVSWTRPTGGMYIWLTLPESMDTGRKSQLFATALELGVLYVPGDYCYPSDPTRIPPKNAIRLAVGVPTIEQIREGVARLANAVTSMLQ